MEKVNKCPKSISLRTIFKIILLKNDNFFFLCGSKILAPSISYPLLSHLFQNFKHSIKEVYIFNN